ncbi:GNAT family N-acetyltransferase [Candidatus Protofrankia datiscae]|uniref:GNAT family N-acetyltransferase n=1 Tax=Candidatus Protofrankia datiscae TaxID=2716812 RepID=UPI000682B0CB|nr:hypothetical protein [Candidatus Protofrankia datiscae]
MTLLPYGQRTSGSLSTEAGSLQTTLARRCVERGYARLNWAVLDWNTPALDFYDSLGAHPLPEWVGHVLTGDRLTALGTP